LAGFSSFNQEATIIVAHHEKWDGSEYPFGIKGSTIPVSARIISAADTYQALIEKRPYKSCWSDVENLDLCLYEGGISYDYEMVKWLTAIIRPQAVRVYMPATTIPSAAAVAR
jgi:putative two-component system response regulator